jgi:hypothetical protein
MTPTGFEHDSVIANTESTLGNLALVGAAESGAVAAGYASDPDLACVMAAWPVLPGHVKAAILALVQSGRQSGP